MYSPDQWHVASKSNFCQNVKDGGSDVRILEMPEIIAHNNIN